MQEKGLERRRFERKELSTEVKYTVVFPSGKLGMTKNISQGGIMPSNQ